MQRQMVVTNETEGTWKEAVVAYLPWGSEEKHEVTARNNRCPVRGSNIIIPAALPSQNLYDLWVMTLCEGYRRFRSVYYLHIEDASAGGGLMLLRDVPIPYQSERCHNPSGTAGDAGFDYRTEAWNSNVFVCNSPV
jgi:hypothetical protein